MEEINSLTLYGQVTLKPCYDCSNGSFYTAYDEAGNYLGELWDYPVWDEDDEENSAEAFRIRIEVAIDANELAIPLSNTEKETNKVWTATICINTNGLCVAYSDVFHTQDKALEYRKEKSEEWMKTSNVRIDPTSTYVSGLFMEMADEKRDNVFTATIKETEIK
jgi:hypothetical protein